MAEDDTAPDAMQFEPKEYDVTCCLEYLHCGSTKLILGREEAEMKRNVCFGLCNSTKRGPYGELGTVDIAHVCCFIGFAANSLMLQQGQCQSTGCGCERQKVNEIVTELKHRQAFRGDRAKVRLAETTLSSIKDLNTKVITRTSFKYLMLDPVPHSSPHWSVYEINIVRPFLRPGRFDP